MRLSLITKFTKLADFRGGFEANDTLANKYCLYLLNKEKTVLLKDATAQAIEEYLTNVELE